MIDKVRKKTGVEEKWRHVMISSALISKFTSFNIPEVFEAFK